MEEHCTQKPGTGASLLLDCPTADPAPHWHELSIFESHPQQDQSWCCQSNSSTQCYMNLRTIDTLNCRAFIQGWTASQQLFSGNYSLEAGLLISDGVSLMYCCDCNKYQGHQLCFTSPAAVVLSLVLCFLVSLSFCWNDWLCFTHKPYPLCAFVFFAGGWPQGANVLPESVLSGKNVP